MRGLRRLASSAKFQTAIIGFIGVLLAHYSGLPGDVQLAAIGLAAAVIGGIAYEDGQAKSAPTQTQSVNVLPPDK
jgi:hypothetical protein